MSIKSHIDVFNATVTRKAVMRYMTIVMDFSVGSLKQDLRPNRAIVMKDKISMFIREFADQNPLSKISTMVTFKEGARLLSDFIEAPTDHVQKMCMFNEFEGNASLQNSLELACENFKSIPSYGRREVLIVFSSLTNSDPGDI